MGYDGGVYVVFGRPIDPDSDTAQRVFELIYGETGLPDADSDNEEYWGDHTDMEAHNNGYYYFLYESTTGSVQAWLTCYVHDHEHMVTRSNDGV